MDVKEINSQKQQEEVDDDVFELLPDALVLEIFNRVQDARSLSACTILCKRFADIVTQTQNVSLQIISPRNTTSFHILNNNNNKSRAAGGGFLGRFVLKPVNDFLRRMMSSRRPKPCCEDLEDDINTFRLPNELLKNFKEVKSLAVKLPGHPGMDGSSARGALLKWKAEFGKELESCVILGATGFMKDPTKGKKEDDVVVSPTTDHHVMNNLTNKQLKKRVVWTISCLIACSARHHMLRQIISANRTLRNVKITDGSKQGTIEMKERQVLDVRNNINNTIICSSSSSVVMDEMERTTVPAVTIKMWYMPLLELAGSDGGVMRGATLAVIRPAAATTIGKEDDVSLAMGAFEDKFLQEAVKKLLEKKKSYTLEMNSF